MRTNHSNHRPHKNTNRLAAYLAAGVGAGILGSHESQAGIVILDLGSFTNLNGGITYGTFGTFHGGNANSGRIDISFLNHYNLPYTGITGYGSPGNLVTGIAAGFSSYSPVKFAQGQRIGSYGGTLNGTSYDFTYNSRSLFSGGPNYGSAPAFGPNSYIGFKTENGDYGWLETTWTGGNGDFQVLAGAFAEGGVPIAAGDTGTSAVPEPGQVASSLLLLALGSAGVAIQRRRAKKKQAAAIALS